MKAKPFLLLAFVLAIGSCQLPLQAQQWNFGFENLNPSNQQPEGLHQWGRGYSLTADSNVRHSGKYSARIEPTAAASFSDFGSWVFTLPAQYEGSKIELRGYLKLQDVTGGFVGLIMRIDGESGMLQFDNMQQRGIRGTADWQQYSIQLPLPADAKSIYVGAIIQGKGTIWVDDLELLIDGKNFSEAKLKQQKVYKASQDSEFDNGSGITAIELSPQTTENLTTLGMVWGFLKYYHPSVAAGDFQWDYELFRVMRDVLRVKGKKPRNEILSRWTDKLGTFEAADKQRFPDSARVKMFPDLAWTSDATELGQKLAVQLDHIRNAKRTSENYYIGLASNVGNPVFRNEKPYAAMPYPDAGYRLLSLFRYWNMIQYYFPYKYLIGEDWKGVLREFVPKFIAVKNELEYKLLLLELIARVHDTHANIWQPDKTLNAFKGSNYAPLTVRFIEDKAVVLEYMNDELGQRTTLKKGDVILSVRGQPVEEIIKSKLPRTPASNYPTQLRMIAADLLRSNDTNITVSYERSGTVSTVTVGCYPPEKLNLAAAYQKKDTCWKFVANDVGYIYPGTIRNVYLPQIMKLFEDLNAQGHTIIIVTHDREIAAHCERQIEIRDGRIKETRSAA